MDREELDAALDTAKSKGFSKLGTGINLVMTAPNYFDYRKEGYTRMGALAETALDLVVPELMGLPAYLGYQAIKNAPGAIVSGAQSLSQMQRSYQRAIQDQSPFRANTFVDSQQIYTMRQAGMALAEQSKYALQQTLMGNEARYMHR